MKEIIADIKAMANKDADLPNQDAHLAILGKMGLPIGHLVRLAESHERLLEAAKEYESANLCDPDVTERFLNAAAGLKAPRRRSMYFS